MRCRRRGRVCVMCCLVLLLSTLFSLNPCLRFLTKRFSGSLFPHATRLAYMFWLRTASRRRFFGLAMIFVMLGCWVLEILEADGWLGRTRIEQALSVRDKCFVPRRARIFF
ncbi:hypothetical protein QBC47DRAFT_222572 [Echria macrotheca]|uniref:Uncharacterized protein n=1 Tax=Echria macrotheca TaxID=438768 RepID=A0AAJ0F5K7_9PEZI|nr:hypothetical protein QBC47DRAFT_222572 [Echria macrotheca]